MTNDEMLAIKGAILKNPHLFSARMNRDYETMASIVNETRPADAKLTALDVHACMAIVEGAK